MKTIKINSESGLHARPASQIVNACQSFESEIYLIKGEIKADARSIMNLMAMGVVFGDDITILAEGTDSDLAEEKIASILEGVMHD